MSQLQVFLGAQQAACVQGAYIGQVVIFMLGGYQPPGGRPPGQPNGGAVKLVEQQVVLAAAAILAAQFGITLATGEARRVNEENMQLGALAGGPGLQQRGLAPQLGQLAVT